MKKDVRLEAARGVAAIVVVLHHFFMAFAPKFTGYLPGDRTDKSIVGEWYFAIFNGTGAVYFFFVLSGYVLSLAYINSKRSSVLSEGIFKRLPRLFVPVTISLCITVSLALLNLMPFRETAEVTGSAWLATAGFTQPPKHLSVSYLDAIRQGFATFFTGEMYYNSSIWTMRQEFLGSLIVFLTLPFFASIERRSVYVTVLVITGVSVVFFLPYALPFLIGLSLSIWLSRSRMELHVVAAGAVLLLGLYLLGYVNSIESYGWVVHLEPIWLGPNNSTLVLNTLGATMVLVALVTSRRMAGALGGRIGVFLGQMSFPIYLVHVPVILSFSCYALIWFLEHGLGGWTALNSTLAASLLVIVIAAIPLAVVDVLWVGVLRRITRMFRAGRVETPVAETLSPIRQRDEIATP
jgi:peptidoglycan/LPS O-acetylase OafA/YrhL